MSKRARTREEVEAAKWIGMLPLGEAEVESDSDMCECDTSPTQGELEVGRCSICEGRLWPQWGDE